MPGREERVQILPVPDLFPSFTVVDPLSHCHVDIDAGVVVLQKRVVGSRCLVVGEKGVHEVVHLFGLLRSGVFFAGSAKLKNKNR